MTGLRVVPLGGMHEIREGDDLARLLLAAVRRAGLELADGDVLAVTSKVVAKAEGRTVPLPGDPAARAKHEELGFVEGWGAVTKQLADVAEGLL